MKKYISTDPKIMGGAPVVVGTRIPIARILYLLKEGQTIKEIQEGYPWVPVKKLKGAVSELIDQLSSSEDATKVLQTQVAAR